MQGEKIAADPTIVSTSQYSPSIIAKSITAGLSILDKELRIVWVNKTQERWIAPLDEIRGKHCYNVYEKRKRVCPGCPVIRVFQDNLDECVSLRRNILIADGSRRHFRLTATPIRDTEGNVIQVLELIEDVTGETLIEQGVKKKLGEVSKELDFITKLDRQFLCSREISLDRILKQAIEVIPPLFNTNICNVRLLDGSKKILINRASKGLSKKYTLEKAIIPVGEGIAGKVVETKKPIIIKNIYESDCAKFASDMKKENIRSVMCVPIMSKDEILGAISVYDRKIGAFSKKDSGLLKNFINHIAILIENINIHRKVFSSYMSTIKSLVSAVEARDSYTYGHSEKVTKFALDIANAMGLPKADRIMLAYCGKLHDIGKIAISDAILNKKGPLTAAEMVEIQMHPIKGEEILSNLNFLKEGMPGIRHHHERYDGKGYPDKLKGNDIPLFARIIGCADSFDAMTSERAYRKRMTVETALEEIKLNRKKQFDPEIADIFIKLIKTKKVLDKNSRR